MVNTKVQRPKVSSLFMWNRTKMLISILDKKWPLWMVAMAFSERVFRPDGGFGNMAGFFCVSCFWRQHGGDRDQLVGPQQPRLRDFRGQRQSLETHVSASPALPAARWLHWSLSYPEISRICVAYYSIRQRFFSISKFLKIVPLSYWLDLVLENGHPKFSLAHCIGQGLGFEKENKLSKFCKKSFKLRRLFMATRVISVSFHCH